MEGGREGGRGRGRKHGGKGRQGSRKNKERLGWESNAGERKSSVLNYALGNSIFQKITVFDAIGDFCFLLRSVFFSLSSPGVRTGLWSQMSQFESLLKPISR